MSNVDRGEIAIMGRNELIEALQNAESRYERALDAIASPSACPPSYYGKECPDGIMCRECWKAEFEREG